MTEPRENRGQFKKKKKRRLNSFIFSNILFSFCLDRIYLNTAETLTEEHFRLTKPLTSCYGYSVPIMASMGGVTGNHNERS